MANHIIGDVTEPQGSGMKFIAHCCNNIGAWGSGVVVAISRRWGMPELMYRKWADENLDELKNSLGKIQVVPVERDIMVINIIGQEGIGGVGYAYPPIRYEAIREGLSKAQTVMEKYHKKTPTLHLPRIGAVRAGGDWNKIEQIINETVSFPVYVYTLPHEAKKWEMKNDTSPKDITPK